MGVKPVNCDQIRLRMLELVSGDLPAVTADDVRSHLAECPTCRQEEEQWKRLFDQLNELPVPAMAIDFPRLYREVAEAEQRRSRRWRRAAFACMAAAAALLLLSVLPRLEVRADGNQLTLRWGAAPLAEKRSTQISSRPTAAGPVREVQDQLQVISQIVRALARDIESRDQNQQIELARVAGRLDDLRRDVARHWAATERDVSALYVGLQQKGRVQ
jgi:anti-sigma factor RsiW